MKWINTYTSTYSLPLLAWAEGTVLSLCVCLSVCLLPQNCYTAEPLFNGHFGTSKVSLRKEVPFIERSIYTQLHVVGTCVMSVIERLSIVESAC